MAALHPHPRSPRHPRDIPAPASRLAHPKRRARPKNRGLVPRNPRPCPRTSPLCRGHRGAQAHQCIRGRQRPVTALQSTAPTRHDGTAPRPKSNVPYSRLGSAAQTATYRRIVASSGAPIGAAALTRGGGSSALFLFVPERHVGDAPPSRSLLLLTTAAAQLGVARSSTTRLGISRRSVAGLPELQPVERLGIGS